MLHGGVAAPGVVHLYGIERPRAVADGGSRVEQPRSMGRRVRGRESSDVRRGVGARAGGAGWPIGPSTRGLPDGSGYRRWAGLFEFLVTSDARRVYARTFDDTHEALLAYLLVDALSFSMVRLGREPLHATAIGTARGTAGFLGQSGDGKSTLAALFLRHGGALVADGMLVLTGRGDTLRRGARAAADQAVPRDGRADPRRLVSRRADERGDGQTHHPARRGANDAGLPPARRALYPGGG